VLLDQSECGREPSPAQAIVVSNGQLGFEPELGLAFNVLNVHVSPEFLAGEEEEPIPANAENGGTHNPRIPEIHMRRIGVGRGPGWWPAHRRRFWSVTRPAPRSGMETAAPASSGVPQTARPTTRATTSQDRQA